MMLAFADLLILTTLAGGSATVILQLTATRREYDCSLTALGNGTRFRLSATPAPAPGQRPQAYGLCNSESDARKHGQFR